VGPFLGGLFLCGRFDVVRRSPYPLVEHTFGISPTPGA
jgi:hypothetical protein